MPTVYSSRPSVTTTYSGRDPVGRKYLSTEDWKIITTESWAWIIAIDSSNTAYTTNRLYTWQTWDDLWSQTWDDIGTMTWDDLFTGIKPAIYTSRPII